MGGHAKSLPGAAILCSILTALSSAAAHTPRSGTTWRVFRASSAGRDSDVGGGHGFRRAAGRDGRAHRRDRTRNPRLLRRHRHLGGRARGLDGAPPWPPGRPELGEPNARDRFRAGSHPSGRECAGRRGRRLSARLSRLPQDHPRQRAAHSRCAACPDPGPLRDGSRCAARQADAANESRLLVQPAQSGRHRLVGG